MQAERLARTSDSVGECPVWSPDRGQLFWLDLASPRLHRLDPASGRTDSRPLPGPPPLGGLVATTDPDKLLLGRTSGISLLDIDSLNELWLGGALPVDSGVGYNDAGVDRMGRLWLTTAELSESVPSAGLVRFADTGLVTVDSGFIVGNGPVFSADGSVMFVCDSLARRIVAYTMDSAGAVADKRVIVTFTDAMGFPDGLAIDEEQGLWVAHWDGGMVSRWTFDGQQTEQIAVPTPNVTSVAFGGDQMTQLFITTAAQGSEGRDGAGDLYRAFVDVPGLPEARFIV